MEFVDFHSMFWFVPKAIHERAHIYKSVKALQKLFMPDIIEFYCNLKNGSS